MDRWVDNLCYKLYKNSMRSPGGGRKGKAPMKLFLYVFFGIFMFFFLFGVVKYWDRSLETRVLQRQVVVLYDYSDGRLNALFRCGAAASIVKYDIDRKSILESIDSELQSDPAIADFIANHGEVLLGATGGLTLRQTYPEIFHRARASSATSAHPIARSSKFRQLGAVVIGFASGYFVGEYFAEKINLDCWIGQRRKWLEKQDWSRVVQNLVFAAYKSNEYCIQGIEATLALFAQADSPRQRLDIKRLFQEAEAQSLFKLTSAEVSWEDFLLENGAQNMIDLVVMQNASGTVPRDSRDIRLVRAEYLLRRSYSASEMRTARLALLECRVIHDRFPGLAAYGRRRGGGSLTRYIDNGEFYMIEVDLPRVNSPILD